MFYVCCTLLYVHSSIAIILMGKRELIALLNLSSWCLVMVERVFLAVPYSLTIFEGVQGGWGGVKNYFFLKSIQIGCVSYSHD